MAITAAQLNAVVSVQGASAAASQLSGLGNIVGGLGSSLTGLVAGGIVVAGAALVAFGAKSVQMAADYRQAMNSVQALTGSTTAQMGTYDTALKSLAIDAGVAPTELAKGLYQVISAGYSGAQAINVLTLATEDSKIGMTDEATVADALTNVLADFSSETKNATLVNGIMLETVTLGKSTFQQYATTISRAATVSAQFHISLETMSAAWATMTANGIRAKQASVDFVQLVQTMYGKITTVTDSLHKNGIAFDEAKFNAMSFGDKVQYLNAALQQAIAKHETIKGVTLQAAQALQVLSQHMSTYNTDLGILSNKQEMANKTSQAWAITQSGFNQQMSRAKAALDVLFITIGNALLPALTKLVASVTPIITKFAEWLVSSHALENAIAGVSAFFKQMGDVIGAVLKFVMPIILMTVRDITQLFTWIMSSQTAIQAFKVVAIALGVAISVILVAALVVAVGIISAFMIAVLILMAPLMGIIAIVRNWGAIMNWLGGIVQAVKNAIIFAFTAMRDAVMNALHSILGTIQSVGGMIISALVSPFQAAAGAIRGILGGIGGAVSSLMGSIGGLINAAANVHVPGHASGIINSPFGHFAMVGEAGPELMYVPQGASIIPNNQLGGTGAYAGSGGSDQPIILQIDGRQFARVILPHLANQLRYSVGVHGV